MKTQLLKASVLVVIFVFIATTHGASDYYLLSIGVSDYPFWENKEGLRFGRNDAELMYDFFKENLSPDSSMSVCLTDYKATKNAIIYYISLNSILQNSSQNMDGINSDRTLILYYSGHGYYDKEKNDYYIVPYDALKENTETLLSINELISMVNKSWKNALIIFDCCFNSSGKSLTSLAQKGTKKVLLYRTDLPIISAAPWGEVTYEDPKLESTFQGKRRIGHGIFTYFFYKALSSYESDGNFLDLNGILNEASINIEQHYHELKFLPVLPKYYRVFDNIVLTPLLYLPPKSQEKTLQSDYNSLAFWKSRLDKNWEYIDSFGDKLIFEKRSEKGHELLAIDSNSGKIVWQYYWEGESVGRCVNQEKYDIYLFFSDHYIKFSALSPVFKERFQYPFKGKVRVVKKTNSAVSIQTTDSLFLFQDNEMTRKLYGLPISLLGERGILVNAFVHQKSNIFVLKEINNFERLINDAFDRFDKKYPANGNLIVIAPVKSSPIFIKGGDSYKKLFLYDNYLYVLNDMGELSCIDATDGKNEPRFHLKGIYDFAINPVKGLLFIVYNDKVSCFEITSQKLLWNQSATTETKILTLDEKTVVLIQNNDMKLYDTNTAELVTHYIFPEPIRYIRTVANKMRLITLRTEIIALPKEVRQLSSNAIGYVHFFDKTDSCFSAVNVKDVEYRDSFYKVINYSSNLYSSPSAIVAPIQNGKLLKIIKRDSEFDPAVGGIIFPYREIELLNAKHIRKVLVEGELYDLKPINSDRITIRGLDQNSKYFSVLTDPNYSPSNYKLLSNKQFYAIACSVSFKPIEKSLINFTSTPIGVSVHINKKYRGKTPLTITDVDAYTTIDVDYYKSGYSSVGWKLYAPNKMYNHNATLKINKSEQMGFFPAQISISYYHAMPIRKLTSLQIDSLSRGYLRVDPKRDQVSAFVPIRLELGGRPFAFMEKRQIGSGFKVLSRFGFGIRFEFGVNEPLVGSLGYNLYFQVYKNWSIFQNAFGRVVGMAWADQDTTVIFKQRSRLSIVRTFGISGKLYPGIWFKFGKIVQSNQALEYRYNFDFGPSQSVEQTFPKFNSVNFGLRLDIKQYRYTIFFLSTEWVHSYSGFYKDKPNNEFSLSLNLGLVNLN